jgi:hypothetical protein
MEVFQCPLQTPPYRKDIDRFAQSFYEAFCGCKLKMVLPFLDASKMGLINMMR